MTPEAATGPLPLAWPVDSPDGEGVPASREVVRVFSIQTRSLLLQAGRASLEMWVRAGRNTETANASDALDI